MKLIWSTLCSMTKLPAGLLTLVWLNQLIRCQLYPAIVTQTTSDLNVTPIRRQFQPARDARLDAPIGRSLQAITVHDTTVLARIRSHGMLASMVSREFADAEL